MRFITSVLFIGLFIGCSDGLRKPKINNYNKDIILIDSIPWGKGKTVFWYKLMDGLGTSSVSYIGIYNDACEIDTSNFLVKGDLLYEIRPISPKRLQITSHVGFDIIQANPDIEFVNKHFEYGQKFMRNTLKDEISLESVCK